MPMGCGLFVLTGRKALTAWRLICYSLDTFKSGPRAALYTRTARRPIFEIPIPARAWRALRAAYAMTSEPQARGGVSDTVQVE